METKPTNPIVVYDLSFTDTDLDPTLFESHDAQGGSFGPTEPGTYLALVKSVNKGMKVGLDTYRAGGGKEVAPNPKSPDGKWEYRKVRPAVTLLNADRTQINRQDLTLGAFENGKFIRPDGVENKSPFFSGPTGATSILIAIGVMAGKDGKFIGKFAPEAVLNQIVSVSVSLCAWKEGERELQPKDLRAKLKDFLGSEPKKLDDYVRGIDLLNDSLGDVEDENGKRPDRVWKLKNFILSYYIPASYALDAHDKAAETPLFRAPDGRIFLTEDDYTANKAILSGKPAGAPKPKSTL